MWSSLAIIACSIVIVTSYRSSGGGHGYPPSGGHSGNNHNHASYPHSTGMSGNSHHSNSYPHQNTHYQAPVQTHQSQSQQYGHQQHTQSQQYGQQHHTQSQQYGHQQHIPQTNTVHHHYHYNPPPAISYGHTQHPVYQGAPPTYVYQYRDSGSKYDTLLTGLALYNLGKMSARHDNHYQNNYGYGGYGGYDNYDRYSGNNYNRNNNNQYEYKGSPGEVCKLGVVKENGDSEESKVDCSIMSSFILDAEVDANNKLTSTTTVATNHINMQENNLNPGLSTTNNTNAFNGTDVKGNAMDVQQTDALSDKGPSIVVTPKMQCYVKHITRSHTTRKEIPCGLLTSYAESSLQQKPMNYHYRSKSDQLSVAFGMVLILVALVF